MTKKDGNMLDTLWYEDADGNRLAPAPGQLDGEVPPGAYFQVSRFPNIVRTNHLRFVRREEVDACPHPDENVCATYGWIDGIEGRECSRCHGTQVRSNGEPWADVWDAEGARTAGVGESSWSDDLVTAMVRSSRWTAKEAALWASIACERCINVALHELGTGHGYAAGSPMAKLARTSCEFCDKRDLAFEPMPEPEEVTYNGSIHLLGKYAAGYDLERACFVAHAELPDAPLERVGRTAEDRYAAIRKGPVVLQGPVEFPGGVMRVSRVLAQEMAAPDAGGRVGAYAPHREELPSRVVLPLGED